MVAISNIIIGVSRLGWRVIRVVVFVIFKLSRSILKGTDHSKLSVLPSEIVAQGQMDNGASEAGSLKYVSNDKGCPAALENQDQHDEKVQIADMPRYGLLPALIRSFSRCLNFKDRARRSEYWWVAVPVLLLSLIHI